VRPCVYVQVVTGAKRLDINSNGLFDEVFLDLCMYEDSGLTQSALSTMMIQHSKRQNLFDDLKGLQLLCSSTGKMIV
jgi:hypothetical protein